MPVDSTLTSPATDTDDDLLDTNNTSLIEHSPSEFDTIEWKKRVMTTSSTASNSAERNKKLARKPPPPPPPGPPPMSNGYSNGAWKGAPSSRASRRNSWRGNPEEFRDQAMHKSAPQVSNGGNHLHLCESDMGSGSWAVRDQQQHGSTAALEVRFLEISS